MTTSRFESDYIKRADGSTKWFISLAGVWQCSDHAKTRKQAEIDCAARKAKLVKEYDRCDKSMMKSSPRW